MIDEMIRTSEMCVQLRIRLIGELDNMLESQFR